MYADTAVSWLTEVWNDAVELLDEGRPIRGFCWYGLTDHIDWDTCLREANGNVNTLGLVDLDRRPREIHPIYKSLAEGAAAGRDRKSTRLNSSHANISYAVFCLKIK